MNIAIIPGVFCWWNGQLKHLANAEAMENVFGKLPALDFTGATPAIINSKWLLEAITESSVRLQSPQGEIQTVAYVGGRYQKEICGIISQPSWEGYQLVVTRIELEQARADADDYLQQRTVAEEQMQVAQAEADSHKSTLQKIYDLNTRGGACQEDIRELLEREKIAPCERCHLAACTCDKDEDLDEG